MAKKKDNQEINEVNVQASDEIIEKDLLSGKYPKLAAKAKVKSITKEKNHLRVRFDDLTFSPGQFGQLSAWQDDEDVLLITLEQFQQKMI